MKCLILLAFCFASVFCNISVIDLYQIENQIYDAVLFTDLNDAKMENIKKFAYKYPILTRKPSDCLGHILEIIPLHKVNMVTYEFMDFIKNPCKTLMVTFTSFQDLQEILRQNVKIPGHPYIFAIDENSSEIFEMQFYAQKIVPVSQNGSIFERRSDMTGAIIRLTMPKANIELEKFQKFFNFTIKQVEFKGYGQFKKGKWNGAVGQLLENEIDVAPFDMSHSVARIQVIQPGFSYLIERSYIIYSKKAQQTTSWLAIFEIFTPLSWISIGLSFLLLPLIFSGSLKLKMDSFLWSFSSVAKAFFANSFDVESYLMKKSFGRTILVLTVSLFGGFIFWYFTSVLLSVLIVPSKHPTIEYFDDLLGKNNFKLHMWDGGYKSDILEKWAKSKPKREKTFKRFIEPFLDEDWPNFTKIAATILKRNDPNEALIESSVYFPSHFGKFL